MEVHLQTVQLQEVVNEVVTIVQPVVEKYRRTVDARLFAYLEA